MQGWHCCEELPAPNSGDPRPSDPLPAPHRLVGAVGVGAAHAGPLAQHHALQEEVARSGGARCGGHVRVRIKVDDKALLDLGAVGGGGVGG